MHISMHSPSPLRRVLMTASISVGLLGCTPERSPEIEAPAPATAEGSSGQVQPASPMPTPAGLPGPAVLSARFKITVAIVAARTASIDASAPRPAQAAPAVDAPPLTPLTLVFATNIHGELLDCGCPHHPLGGLARRASIWNGYTDAPALHFDAGNALHKFPPRLGDAGAPTESDTIRAEAIMESLGLMETAFLAVGPRDLPWGGEQLMRWSRTHGVPLLNANVQAGDRLIGMPEVVVNVADGTTVGFTSVLRAEALLDELWNSLDLSCGDAAEAAAAAIGRLRAQQVRLVVLVEPSGGGGLDALVAELVEDGAAPDLIIAAGDGRTTYEPRFVSGVPLVEAGSRGKYIGALNLGLTAAPVRFGSAGGAGLEALEALRTAARLLGQSEVRSARMDLHSENPRMAARTRELLMRQRIEFERAQATWQIALAQPATESGPASELSMDLVAVELELPERDDVRAIVERAEERAAAARSTP